MNKICLALLMALLLLACDEEELGEENRCPVYITQFWGGRYHNGIVFVKESSPSSCFAHALDFVADYKEEQKQEDLNCGWSPVFNWHLVEEIEDRFVNSPESLDDEEVMRYVQQICGYRDLHVDEVLEFSLNSYGAINLSLTANGIRYDGELYSFDMTELSCSAHSINCDVYPNSSVPLPIPIIQHGEL